MIGWLSAAVRQWLSVGDWDTAGDDDPDPSEWDGGRLTWARWMPAHPGRIGGAIRAIGSVVHETQMHPDQWPALLRAWQRSAGRGACAHFLIGRSELDGVVQMVDVARNGNHAGGRPQHGWLLIGGKRVHPNAALVGIEVHTAGPVRLVRDHWRAGEYGKDGWKPHGAPLPAADVEVDARYPARGWHRPTAYQLQELARLLQALDGCPVMHPYPERWSVAANGPTPPWAPRGTTAGRIVVGHVTLDPARKSDPGPILSAWLAQRLEPA